MDKNKAKLIVECGLLIDLLQKERETLDKAMNVIGKIRHQAYRRETGGVDLHSDIGLVTLCAEYGEVRKKKIA